MRRPRYLGLHCMVTARQSSSLSIIHEMCWHFHMRQQAEFFTYVSAKSS